MYDGCPTPRAWWSSVASRPIPRFWDPQSFRALLNSFLPRKRAISQLLVRDHDDRVLLCQLTYKRDWDLPGGVVEVGESPQLAAGREVEEELALDIEPGRLLLTDWLPPWGGWDDALCLVFDGGVIDVASLDAVVRQEREIRDVRFCTSRRSASGPPTSPPVASRRRWPTSPAARPTPSPADPSADRRSSAGEDVSVRSPLATSSPALRPPNNRLTVPMVRLTLTLQQSLEGQ